VGISVDYNNARMVDWQCRVNMHDLLSSDECTRGKIHTAVRLVVAQFVAAVLFSELLIMSRTSLRRNIGKRRRITP